MKGFVEATVPQRQFENIHIHYNFEDETQKNLAMKYLIADMLKYHHEVSRLSKQEIDGDKMEADYKKRNKKLFVTESDLKQGISAKYMINGIEHMKMGGEWQRMNPVEGRWEVTTVDESRLPNGS